MVEISRLSKLPPTKRNVNTRATAKTTDILKRTRAFSQDYFDGDRDSSHGGYRYDERWIPLAWDIVTHFGLKTGDRVLYGGIR